MPAVGEQMAIPGSRTNPDLVASRFLLKPDRKYEDGENTKGTWVWCEVETGGFQVLLPEISLAEMDVTRSRAFR